MKNYFHQVSFAKNVKLLEQGRIENYLYFIEEGLVRFHIENNEKDTTFNFGLEGQFISAYDSFLTQAPSTYSVSTLSKTILSRINYQDLQLVYKNTSVGEKIGRLAAEELFKLKINRLLSMLNETPEQRYLNLLQTRKEYLQKIPLKYLASYIGVAPETLSRIRKRIS